MKIQSYLTLQILFSISVLKLDILSVYIATGQGKVRVASCELQVASCELRVASCKLRVASCKMLDSKSENLYHNVLLESKSENLYHNVLL